MKIILSPAKKMRTEDNSVLSLTVPVYLVQAEEILRYLQGLSFAEAKKLWACNDKIAEANYERLVHTDLRNARMATPAVLAYDGIAYQYMTPAVFEDAHYAYVQEHLRILSGFYGVLKPADGVFPYRLEMQAKAKVAGTADLYEFWGRRLYEEAADESRVIVNLASKEYSVCVEKYLEPKDRYITCVFGKFADTAKEKIVQKGVYAKMARGDMVRFMAEHRIEDPEEMKAYQGLGYHFLPERSSDTEYVFIK